MVHSQNYFPKHVLRRFIITCFVLLIWTRREDNALKSNYNGSIFITAITVQPKHSGQLSCKANDYLLLRIQYRVGSNDYPLKQCLIRPVFTQEEHFVVRYSFRTLADLHIPLFRIRFIRSSFVYACLSFFV